MLQKTRMTFLRLFAVIAFVVLFAIASIGLASCSSDSITVTGVGLDDAGTNLVVTYSDGSTQDLGTVVGTDGADGVTITNFTTNYATDGTTVLGYTVTYSDGTTYTITNGTNGTNGTSGVTITSITEVTDSNGTGAKVVYSDGEEFTVYNGADGNGIAKISSAVSEEDSSVTIITVTYTNGKTETFEVANGTNGTDGVGIANVAKTETTTGVTYTITFTDSSITPITLTVTNGENGKDGEDGEDGATWSTGDDAAMEEAAETANEGDFFLWVEDGITAIYTFVDGEWVNVVEDLTGATGEQGLTGTGIKDITYDIAAEDGESYKEGDSLLVITMNDGETVYYIVLTEADEDKTYSYSDIVNDGGNVYLVYTIEEASASNGYVGSGLYYWVEGKVHFVDEIIHEHDYEKTLIAATCTSGSYYQYICECGAEAWFDLNEELAEGAEYTLVDLENKTEGMVNATAQANDMLAHTLTAVELKDATCFVNGYKAHYTCADCSFIFVDAGTDTADSTGKVGNGEASELYIQITNANKDTLYTIFAYGHTGKTASGEEITLTLIHADAAATCLDGYLQYYTCSLCENYVVPTKDGAYDLKTFDTYTVIDKDNLTLEANEADVAAGGVIRTGTGVHNYVDTDRIIVLGPANSTATNICLYGYMSYQECSNEGCSAVQLVTYKGVGYHLIDLDDEDTKVTQPKESETGSITGKCSVCGKSLTYTLPSLTDGYEKGVYTATGFDCSNDGFVTYAATLAVCTLDEDGNITAYGDKLTSNENTENSLASKKTFYLTGEKDCEISVQVWTEAIGHYIVLNNVQMFIPGGSNVTLETVDDSTDEYNGMIKMTIVGASEEDNVVYYIDSSEVDSENEDAAITFTTSDGAVCASGNYDDVYNCHAFYYCTQCGSKISISVRKEHEELVEWEKAGDAYDAEDENHVSTAATCSKDGVQYYYCSVCKEIIEVTLPATDDHQFTYTVNKVEVNGEEMSEFVTGGNQDETEYVITITVGCDDDTDTTTSGSFTITVLGSKFTVTDPGCLTEGSATVTLSEAIAKTLSNDYLDIYKSTNTTNSGNYSFDKAEVEVTLTIPATGHYITTYTVDGEGAVSSDKVEIPGWLEKAADDYEMEDTDVIIYVGTNYTYKQTTYAYIAWWTTVKEDNGEVIEDNIIYAYTSEDLVAIKAELGDDYHEDYLYIDVAKAADGIVVCTTNTSGVFYCAANGTHTDGLKWVTIYNVRSTHTLQGGEYMYVDESSLDSASYTGTGIYYTSDTTKTGTVTGNYTDGEKNTYTITYTYASYIVAAGHETNGYEIWTCETCGKVYYLYEGDEAKGYAATGHTYAQVENGSNTEYNEGTLTFEVQCGDEEATTVEFSISGIEWTAGLTQLWDPENGYFYTTETITVYVTEEGVQTTLPEEGTYTTFEITRKVVIATCNQKELITYTVSSDYTETVTIDTKDAEGEDAEVTITNTYGELTLTVTNETNKNVHLFTTTDSQVLIYDSSYSDNYNTSVEYTLEDGVLTAKIYYADSTENTSACYTSTISIAASGLTWTEASGAACSGDAVTGTLGWGDDHSGSNVVSVSYKTAHTNTVWISDNTEISSTYSEEDKSSEGGKDYTKFVPAAATCTTEEVLYWYCTVCGEFTPMEVGETYSYTKSETETITGTVSAKLDHDLYWDTETDVTTSGEGDDQTVTFTIKCKNEDCTYSYSYNVKLSELDDDPVNVEADCEYQESYTYSGTSTGEDDYGYDISGIALTYTVGGEERTDGKGHKAYTDVYGDAIVYSYSYIAEDKYYTVTGNICQVCGKLFNTETSNGIDVYGAENIITVDESFTSSYTVKEEGATTETYKETLVIKGTSEAENYILYVSYGTMKNLTLSVDTNYSGDAGLVTVNKNYGWFLVTGLEKGSILLLDLSVTTKYSLTSYNAVSIYLYEYTGDITVGTETTIEGTEVYYFTATENSYYSFAVGANNDVYITDLNGSYNELYDGESCVKELSTGDVLIIWNYSSSDTSVVTVTKLDGNPYALALGDNTVESYIEYSFTSEEGGTYTITLTDGDIEYAYVYAGEEDYNDSSDWYEPDYLNVYNEEKYYFVVTLEAGETIKLYLYGTDGCTLNIAEGGTTGGEVTEVTTEVPETLVVGKNAIVLSATDGSTGVSMTFTAESTGSYTFSVSGTNAWVEVGTYNQKVYDGVTQTITATAGDEISVNLYNYDKSESASYTLTIAYSAE